MLSIALNKKYALAITFVVIVVTGILLYFPFPARLSIEGLHDNYKVKEPIKFILIANGCGSKCDNVEITVTLKEKNQVLYSTAIVDGSNSLPLLTNIREQIPADGVVSIDESGIYTLVIDYNGSIIEKKITII